MRSARALRLAPLAMILFIAGCSSSNKGKIEVTKWTSQPATIKGKSYAAGALHLDFGGDGSLVYKTPNGDFRGSYSLGTFNFVSFHLDRALPNGMKDMTETIRINGNQMTVRDLDGTEVTFTKDP